MSSRILSRIPIIGRHFIEPARPVLNGTVFKGPWEVYYRGQDPYTYWGGVEISDDGAVDVLRGDRSYARLGRSGEENTTLPAHDRKQLHTFSLRFLGRGPNSHRTFRMGPQDPRQEAETIDYKDSMRGKKAMTYAMFLTSGAAYLLLLILLVAASAAPSGIASLPSSAAFWPFVSIASIVFVSGLEYVIHKRKMPVYFLELMDVDVGGIFPEEQANAQFVWIMNARIMTVQKAMEIIGKLDPSSIRSLAAVALNSDIARIERLNETIAEKQQLIEDLKQGRVIGRYRDEDLDRLNGKIPMRRRLPGLLFGGIVAMVIGFLVLRFSGVI